MMEIRQRIDQKFLILGWHPYVLAFLLAAGIVFRLGYLREPRMGWDESIYLTAADAMNHGEVLYTGVWDHKPPGIFWIYQAILFLHRSAEAVHFTSMLLVLASAVLLYRLTAGFFSKTGALAAVWLWLVYTSAFWAAAFNTEIVLVFLQLLTLRTVWRDAGWHEQPARWAIAGLLTGLAVMVKYVALLPALAIASCAFLFPPLPRPLPGQRWKPVLAFTAGMLCFPVLAVVVCAYQGSWSAFRDAAWQYNADYVLFDAWNLFLQYGLGFLADYARQQWPVLILGVAGLAGLHWFGRPDPGRASGHGRNLLLVFWLAGNLLAALAPLKYLDHYFLLTLPVFCCLAGSLPGSLLPRGKWLFRLAALLIIVLPLPVASRQVHESIERFSRLPARVEASAYPSAVVGRYIQANTKSSDTIWVWRGEVDVYFYARRRPACRFFFWPHLLRDFLPPAAEELFLQDMRARPPAMVLVGRDALLADRTFPVMDRWLQKNYRFDRERDGYDIYRPIPGAQLQPVRLSNNRGAISASIGWNREDTRCTFR